jgi:hypothetical protein
MQLLPRAATIGDGPFLCTAYPAFSHRSKIKSGQTVLENYEFVVESVIHLNSIRFKVTRPLLLPWGNEKYPTANSHTKLRSVTATIILLTAVLGQQHPL